MERQEIYQLVLMQKVQKQHYAKTDSFEECTINLFTGVIYRFSLVFVLGKPFQPSIMFVGKARSLT